MNIINNTFTNNTDTYNAINSGGSLKDIAGNTIDIVGAVVYEDEDKKTGETKTITSFKTSEGEFYGTVSANVLQNLDSMMAMGVEFSEEKPLSVMVVSKSSKNDREFLSLKML